MNWRLKYFIFIVIVSFIVAAFSIDYILDEKINEQKSEIIELKPEKVEAKKVPVSSVLIKFDIDDMAKMTLPKGIAKETIPQTVSLGEFRLTAYCSCEKCCDGWAKNRPLDKNGN